MSVFIRLVALTAMLAVGWPAQGDNPKNRAKQNRKADAARQAAQNEREREQREKAQELQQAAKALSKQEQEAFARANSELAEARAAHRAAGKALTETRTRVESELGKSLGLEAAVSKMMAAEAAYREASAPILEKLRATVDHSSARKTAEAAESQIKVVQKDPGLNAEEKRSQISELQARVQAVSDLEKENLKKDPAVLKSREALEAERDRVTALREKIESKIDKDTDVQKAQAGVEQALAEVKAAESRLAKLTAQANAAEQRLRAGIVPKKDNDDSRKDDQKSKGQNKD